MPGVFPVVIADRLRGEGIDVVVDQPAFNRRRRAKNELEIDGVRRAQAAANGAMGVAADMLRRATAQDGVL